MSTNPGGYAPAQHQHAHRPCPQAPPQQHPRPQVVGRNRSGGRGGDAMMTTQQKGGQGQFRNGGPQAPPLPPHGGLRRGGSGGGVGPRRGSGRRSPVPFDSQLPSQRPRQGGGGGGQGRGHRRGSYQPNRGPWSNDADEALRQSHLLKLALERRGKVFDSESGLRRRRDVMGQLEGFMGRWAEGLHPVGGSAAGERGQLLLAHNPPSADEDAVSVGDAPDDDDDEDEDGDGVAVTAEGGPVIGPPGMVRHPRVVLISFGSYRLGVHRRDGDIDALALCPPHCTRADFFGSLVKMLKDDERVTELHPVPGAYTPVLKFYLSGVPIDLLFARLANDEKLRLPPPGLVVLPNMPGMGEEGVEVNLGGVPVPPSPGVPPREEFQLEDSDLVGLDEAGVRSLNGVRVAQTLLRAVPDLDTYRLTLRAVKEWALVRGLYSNVLGFLGGVNWAILVAWICVRNEGAPAPLCLARFMYTFARWKWPKPLLLGPIASSPPVPGIAPLPVWNPRTNPRDAAQLMPIITPCYPSMNSAYNVGQPQLRRIQQELYRGQEIVNGVAAGRNSWEDLFASRDFFGQHAHYLQVNVMARNAEDFRAWFGLCESRLRILIAGLESPEYGVQCYPFAKFFQRKVPAEEGGDDGKTDGNVGDASPDLEQESPRHRHVSSFFVALRFAYGVENVDLRSCTEEFLYKVNAWEERKWGMDLTIEHRTREHLPAFVFEDNDNQEEDCEAKKEKGRVTKTIAQVLREAAKAAGGRGERDDPPALPPGAADHAPSPPTNPSPHKRARRDSPE